MIIDFSAHDKWDFCPAAWYETYVNKRRKKWPKAQRNDALCLGSLVHTGLEVWQKTHTVAIPDSAVEENTPDKATFDLALELVHGYAMAYPQEHWPLIMCEEPLRFPLLPAQTEQHCNCNYPIVEAQEALEGLAKIDAYFYVPELTVIESGVPSITTVLTPGWWIHEYKTKNPKTGVGLYMQSWEMGMQASYQVMALKHNLTEEMLNYLAGVESPEDYPQVQGVLINVIEKPERHIPKRKCKECDDSYEMWSWLPTGTGEYACPVCGNRQKLMPIKLDVPARPANYYRIVVTRDAKQLAEDREQIIQVGQRMIQMERAGLHSEPWHKKNCVDIWWRRSCDYFGPHKNDSSTLDDPGYFQPADYRGLTQIEI